MNEAQTIARTLDRFLREKTEIIVFGAGALLLDPKFSARMTNRRTNDIDIVIPSERELKVDADKQFWKAIEESNRALESKNLYLTHIFAESQVVLTPEWKSHLVPMPDPRLERLSIVRPRVLDLIVSKMGRGDLRDQEDVRVLLRLHREVEGGVLTADEVAAAARRARVPEVYRELFQKASAAITEVARRFEQQWEGPWNGGPGIGPSRKMRP